MESRSLSRKQIIVGLGGLLLLIGSFLPFYKAPIAESTDEFDLGAVFGALLDTSWKVWSDAWSMFPILPVAIILLLSIVAVVVLPTFTGIRTPQKMFGQQFDQFARCASLLALATIANYILRNFANSTTGWELEAGTGAWVTAVGAALVVIGIFSETTGSVTTQVSPLPPPTPQHSTKQSGLVIDARVRNFMLLSGLVGLFVATFLKVVGASFSSESEDGTINGWSDGGRPVYLWGALIVVVFTIITVAYRFNPDAKVALTGQTLRTTQINLSVYALLHALTLTLGNFLFGGFGGMVDPAIGVYVSLIAAVVLVIATISRPATTGSDFSQTTT